MEVRKSQPPFSYLHLLTIPTRDNAEPANVGGWHELMLERGAKRRPSLTRRVVMRRALSLRESRTLRAGEGHARCAVRRPPLADARPSRAREGVLVEPKPTVSLAHASGCDVDGPLAEVTFPGDRVARAVRRFRDASRQVAS